MKNRHMLRSFYYSPSANRRRRTLELRTNRTKDRMASREREFLYGDLKNCHFIMAIGNKGTGVRSNIKGFDRRGGKWLQKIHSRYATTHTTDEHKTSQLCIYCYSQLHHPILGTSQCLNPNCPAVKIGRATNNRDIMSATAIGISGMTKMLLNKDLPPFCS